MHRITATLLSILLVMTGMPSAYGYSASAAQVRPSSTVGIVELAQSDAELLRRRRNAGRPPGNRANANRPATRPGANRPGNRPGANRPDNRPGVSRPPANRPGWHNGYRGSRHSRPGYRRSSDGWWFPMAAFGAGLVVGGAMNQPTSPSLSNRHIHWCYDRWQTYRSFDNTFVPRVGVRAQCVSPYSR
jgi:hypothetical protein